MWKPRASSFVLHKMTDDSPRLLRVPGDCTVLLVGGWVASVGFHASLKCVPVNFVEGMKRAYDVLDTTFERYPAEREFTLQCM